MSNKKTCCFHKINSLKRIKTEFTKLRINSQKSFELLFTEMKQAMLNKMLTDKTNKIGKMMKMKMEKAKSSKMKHKDKTKNMNQLLKAKLKNNNKTKVNIFENIC